MNHCIYLSKNSVSILNDDFITDNIPTSKQVLIDLAKMYNIAGLYPFKLRGSGQQVNIVLLSLNNVCILCLVIKV